MTLLSALSPSFSREEVEEDELSGVLEEGADIMGGMNQARQREGKRDIRDNVKP